MAPSRASPCLAMRQHSATPSPMRRPMACSRSWIGPDRARATTPSNFRSACCASEHEPAPRVAHLEGSIFSPAGRRGTANATRAAHAAPPTSSASGPSPVAMPSAVPAPASRIADGETTASATARVRTRSGRRAMTTGGEANAGPNGVAPDVAMAGA